MKRFDTPEAQAIYNRLRTQTGSYYEVKVIRGSGQNAVEYGMNKLKSIRIKPALFEKDGPQIGGVHSTSCEMKLLETTEQWPRMAMFEVQIRITNGNSAHPQYSDWIHMGLFYTDERHADKYGNLSIVGFDPMLKLEQTWTDKVASLPSQWPITSYAASLLICEATGIQLDSGTVLDNTKAYIGLDTTSTARDVMKSIAVGNGGSWYVKDDGKYKLVKLVNLTPGSAAIAGIAISGISVVGDGEIDTADGAASEINAVGFNVQDIDFSSQLQAISGVEVKSPYGTTAFAGTRTGYVLKASCAYADTNIAELCLTKVSGYVYTPFSASTARLDPLAEVGDLVYIAGNTYPIVTLDWNIAPHITADISAPFEEEIDHEYQVTSDSAKNLHIAVGEANSYTDNALNTFISGTYASDKTNLQSQIDGKAETWYQSTDPSTAWTTAELRAAHVGDLWYKTSDNTTWYYNGTTWVQQNVPDSVFDAIDGKAQIFTAQPTPPYNIGDLWVQGSTGDIMRCRTAKTASGSYAAADWILASKYTDDSALQAFLTGTYATDIQSLETQIDGKAETWYQTSDPSSAWTTAALKEDHIGDLWYNSTSSVQKYYRWNGTAWAEMTASPPQAVFDQIDGKAQIFVSQPTPPYNVGDLWVQGETGDIKRCSTERVSGSYTASDWTLASKYTDDTALTNWLSNTYASDKSDLQSQIDGKVQTYSQSSNPATSWTSEDEKAKHVGDLWYRTSTQKYYRYKVSGSSYSWEEITATPPSTIITTINSKAQIFTAQPTPPYSVGDLWFNSTTSDIMTCIMARATGSYTASDWQKRNKYTDDTKANSVETDLHTNYETAVDTRSYIQQTERSLTQGIATTYVSNQALANALLEYSPTEQIEQNYYTKEETNTIADGLASEIQLTDDNLTIAFSQISNADNKINAMTYYIRYQNGVIIIGKTDSPTSVRISNDQIALYYGNEMLSYWNQNKQYTPKELQIPAGGKFTLGSILFQPRSSGNMSLMWVG